MFYADRISNVDRLNLEDVLDIPRLFRHRFSEKEFLTTYRSQAKIAVMAKLRGLRDIASYLLDLISDEKTLHAAFVHLKTYGSLTPGPDGLRYDNIDGNAGWPGFRMLRDSIRAGEHVRLPEYVQKISKGPGRGVREITIQCIDDRIVQRAIVEILQPLLDPLFDPRSFGYRPKKGSLDALACAEQLSKKKGCYVWVSVDIKNAFPNVPVNRLLAVLQKYFPNKELMNFLKTVIEPDKTSGLRQGSPLSPLLLNLYLHHCLDQPWRKSHPNVPLIRFADDILLLCRTSPQGRNAYRYLADLLRPAGFTLKEDQLAAIHQLSTGDRLHWMGYEIARANRRLTYSLTERAWDKLAEALKASHTKPHSPIRAIQSLAAWINSKAPCYPHLDLSETYNRIQALAIKYGYTEILTVVEFEDFMKVAYARWCKQLKHLSSRPESSHAEEK